MPFSATEYTVVNLDFFHNVIGNQGLRISMTAGEMSELRAVTKAAGSNQL